MPSSTRPIIIKSPRVERTADGWSRVSAEIDGFEIFFASRDVELDANPESFVAAILVPALVAGRPIEVEAPLQPGWKEDLERMMEIIERFWKYPPISITGSVTANPFKPVNNRAGVFFSGGVDAFHTLLCSPSVDALVFVRGFDLRLNERYDAMARIQEEETRRIAASRGLEAIVVRTSIRAHPLQNLITWRRANGGGMAAVGHTLRRHLGTIRIASSCEGDADSYLRGSHPQTDPFWQAGAITIDHFGAEQSRLEKIIAISHDEDAARSLRVCWQKPTTERLNCCRCEKCLRTMLLLIQTKLEHRFPTLSPPEPIPRLIDQIPHTAPEAIAYWSGDTSSLPPDIAAAARRLVERSERQAARSRNIFSRGWARLRGLLET